MLLNALKQLGSPGRKSRHDSPPARTAASPTSEKSFSGVEQALIYALANAQVRPYPYPHFFLRDVFPPAFFQALRRHWPRADQFVCINDTGRVSGYEDRFVAMLDAPTIEGMRGEQQDFWRQVQQWLLGPALAQFIARHFRPYYAARIQAESDAWSVEVSPEVLLVRDRTDYKIGPHTDSPSRLMTFLFYCPADESLADLGTSVFVPRQPGFTCTGVTHYKFPQFINVATMPFVPNSLFAFVKTDNSFHGVEPIAQPDVRRDLLLYNLRLSKVIGGTDRYAPDL